MNALIAGATGLVGSYLLQILIEDQDYDQVWALTRRPLNIKHKKIREIIIDYEHLGNSLIAVEAEHIYCCLGTTLKKAGSKQSFRKVDFEYPLELAKIMLSKKAEKYFLVSALGASKNSPFFYNRVKGEVEEAIYQLGFSGFFIFRPSLLLGDRDEVRAVEEIVKKMYKYLEWLFKGPLKKYKGIHARTVAASMVNMAKKDQSGTVILESDQIREALIVFYGWSGMRSNIKFHIPTIIKRLRGLQIQDKNYKNDPSPILMDLEWSGKVSSGEAP